MGYRKQYFKSFSIWWFRVYKWRRYYNNKEILKLWIRTWF